MSRVLYVSVTPEEAMTACRKHDARVSTTESLPSGGTRLVLASAAATATMHKAFGRRIIAGDVARHPLVGHRVPR